MARAKMARGTTRYRTPADSVVPEIVGLRHRGLGYRAIAEAIGFFKGVVLTPNQVEYALAREGEPPSAAKARA